MDFKKLIPDFSAIGRTNWAKPCIKKNDKNWLIAAGLVVLMLVFVFLPWCSVSYTVEGVTSTGSRLGISTWFGIIAFICAIVAAYGVLYEQKQFVFCASVLGAFFGLLGIFLWADVTLFAKGTQTGKLTSDYVAAAKLAGASIGHIGAILFLLASAGSAAWSYLQIKNEK